MRPLPEQDYLRDCFDYDPATGVLTWRHRADRAANWNARFAGKSAGSLDREASPFRMGVTIDGRRHLSSRIIWKLMTGRDPTATIDHVNGNALDNRWKNLREATMAQQSRNRKRARLSKHGVRGVLKVNSEVRPWLAQVSFNNKNIYLGVYATLEEANSAYKAFAVKHYGEFYVEPEVM